MFSCFGFHSLKSSVLNLSFVASGWFMQPLICWQDIYIHNEDKATFPHDDQQLQQQTYSLQTLIIKLSKNIAFHAFLDT